MALSRSSVRSPHCGHIAEQGLGVKIYISNVAKHLLETHGIDSSNSLSQQVSSSTSLKQVTLTDSRLLCPLLHTIDPLHEGKLLLLRCIIQNAWAFNHMDSDSWIALSSYYSRPAWCSTTMKSFVVQRATQLRRASWPGRTPARQRRRKEFSLGGSLWRLSTPLSV